MKKINLIINSLDDKNEPLKVKSFTVQGRLYFWERVEIEITNLEVEDEKLVRAALYDVDVQLCFASEFKRTEDGNLTCVLVLRTQALSDALAETKPNRAKNFTFYFWNGYQEEVSFVGNIPIYQNPYVQDEYGPEITVDANILIQYSVHGSDDWSDEVEDGTRYIRFSMDKGLTWGDAIFLGAPIDEIEVLEQVYTLEVDGPRDIEFDGYILGVESYPSQEGTQTEKIYPRIFYVKEYGMSHIVFDEDEYVYLSGFGDGKNIIKIQYLKQ
jgi:hypothetical protein